MILVDARSQAILLNRYLAYCEWVKYDDSRGKKYNHVVVERKKWFAIQWQNVSADIVGIFTDPFGVVPRIAFSLVAFLFIALGEYQKAQKVAFEMPMIAGALAYDSAGQTSHSGEPSTVSYTHNVGSGSDRLAVWFGSGLSTPSTPTFGGSSGTAIFTTVGNLIGRYLVAPTSGNNTVSMGGGNIKVLCGVTFSGADQTDPIGASTTENGSSSPNDMSLTTEANDSIRVDVLGSNRDDSNSPSMTLDSGTNRCNPITPQNQFRIGLSVYTNVQAVAGSDTHQWTTSGFNRWYAAFEVKQAAASITEKSVADTGSGTEQVTILNIFTKTDTGSGVDAISQILRPLTVTDTGTGVDVVNLMAFVAMAEAATGVDAVSLLAFLQVADTGSGIDTVYITRILAALADSGSGIDGVSILAVLPVVDSGSGSDQISLLALLSIPETGSGVDGVVVSTTGEEKNISDSGSGSDATEIMAFATITDNGSGIDQISLTAMIPVSDSGSGADAFALLAMLTQSDSGSGVDQDQITALLNETDSGSGNDAVSLQALLTITDSATASEVIHILAGIIVPEIGTGVDATSIMAQLNISDSATVTDTLQIMAFVGIDDAGAGTDLLSFLMMAYVNDTAIGTDALALMISLAVTDTAVGNEALLILNSLGVTDAATGEDFVGVLNELLVGDTGSGEDTVGHDVHLNIGDSATASEVIEVVRLFINAIRTMRPTTVRSNLDFTKRMRPKGEL